MIWVLGVESVLPGGVPVEAKVAGPGPMVAAMCDAEPLVEVIDGLVAWDPAQGRLSPGTRIKTLVVNMRPERRPPYRVHEAYAERDVELVLGSGVKAADINDNALARALDKLLEAGAKRVYSAVASRAVLLEGVDDRAQHWDSTSRSVWGEYAGDNGPWKVTHGYSKDKRPDLHQFLIALLCHREGVPLAATGMATPPACHGPGRRVGPGHPRAMGRTPSRRRGTAGRAGLRAHPQSLGPDG